MKQLRTLMLVAIVLGVGLEVRRAFAQNDWKTSRSGYAPSQDPVQDAERQEFEDQIEILENSADWENVIATAQDEQKRHPDNPGGPYAEALGRYYNGDIEGALPLWDKARTLGPALAPKAFSLKLQAAAIRRKFPTLRLLPLRVVRSDVDAEKALYVSKGRSLLEAKKYDEIETVARQLQKSNATDISGDAHLDSFFEGLTSLDDEPRVRQAQIAQWRRARPQSNLARIAAIEMWTNVVWRYRGHGVGSTITQEMMDGMVAALERAGQGLKDLPKSAFDSPLAYVATLDYEHIGDFSHEQMDAVTAQGLKRFPGYQKIYELCSIYRLPKWGGEPGETEAFVEKRADTLGGEAGDIFYARLVWLLLGQDPQLWDHTTFSYDRFQRGIKALDAQHPNSLALRTATLMGAIQHRDYNTVNAYFTAPAGNIIAQSWKDSENQVFVCQWRMWSLSLNTLPTPGTR